MDWPAIIFLVYSSTIQTFLSSFARFMLPYGKVLLEDYSFPRATLQMNAARSFQMFVNK
jgi:hypothetical protein